MTDQPVGLELSLLDRDPDRQPPAPTRRNPLLAFLLSLPLPGLGHFYCRKWKRGFTTLGFFLLGIVLIVGASVLTDPTQAERAAGVGLTLAFAFYGFGFLDAYFTAGEMNEGVHDFLPHNPRVAALLNFVTNGLGYFYVGQKRKGIVLFVSLWIFDLAAQRGFGQFWPLVAIFYALLRSYMAVDAYRIAARDTRDVRPLLPAVSPASSKGVPTLPLAAACGLMAVYFGLILLGSVFESMDLTPEDELAEEDRASARAPEAPPIAALPVVPPTSLPLGIQWNVRPTEPPLPTDLPALAEESVRRVGEGLTDFDVRTYVHEGLGLKMTFPRTWSYQPGGGFVVSASSADAECTMTMSAKSAAGLPTLSDFVSGVAEQMLQGSSGRHLRDRRTIAVGNLAAEELVYERMESGRARRETHLLTHAGQYFYWLETDALPGSQCEAEAAWVRGQLRFTQGSGAK